MSPSSVQFSPALSSTSRHKLLVFQLGNEHYGLPLLCVQGIFNRSKHQCDPENGHCCMQFQGSPLTLLDSARLLSGDHDVKSCNYLIVCAIASGSAIGIPSPELPYVWEVADSQLLPIPQSYRQAGFPPAITALIYIAGDRELYVLDLEQLWASALL
jgi:chemotaxis signal transduction protein